MHRIMSSPRNGDQAFRQTPRNVVQTFRQTLRSLLLGTAAAAIFVTTTFGQINDAIRGAASEANHFIETPKGWVHPKTPWGEPDIQANLNMMQAAGVPLERCANATRFGGAPCDMNKAWLTEEELKERIAIVAGRGDLGRQLIEKGEFGRALLSGVTDPATPQRQTTLIVDPPSGAAARPDPGGQTARARDAQRMVVARRVAGVRLAHATSTAGTAAPHAACPRR